MRSRIAFTETRGVAADQPPVVMPDGVLTDARNFRFRDSGAELVTGYSSVFGSLSVTAMYVTSITDGTVRYWVYASETVAYATDGTSHVNIKLSATVSAEYDVGYTGGPFNGYVILNDGGQNVPVSWLPNAALTNRLVSLTAWPSDLRTDVMRFHRGFIFAGRNANVSANTYNPRELRWSDQAQPGALPLSWDYTVPTNQAGITELGETSDSIVDMVTLRDSFLIYKESNTWAADYVQTRDVFSFRPLFRQLGLLAENCAIDFNESHFVVTDTDIVLHDGNNVRSLADGRMRRWFFNRLDNKRYRTTFVVTDHENREILICFPEAGSDWPNLAMVWNWSADSWTVRDLGSVMRAGADGIVPSSTSVTFDTWSGTGATTTGRIDEVDAPAARKLVLVSGSSPAAFVMDSGYALNGATMTAYIERRGISLSGGDVLRVKRIKRIYPLLLGETSQMVSVYIGARMALDEPVVMSGPYSFVVGSDHKIDVRVSGRFLDLRMEYAAAYSLRCIGIDVDYDADGLR
jgi:hypothetical protein